MEGREKRCLEPCNAISEGGGGSQGILMMCLSWGEPTEVSWAHHSPGSDEHSTESFRVASEAGLSQHPDMLGTQYVSVRWRVSKDLRGSLKGNRIEGGSHKLHSGQGFRGWGTGGYHPLPLLLPLALVRFWGVGRISVSLSSV